MIEPLAAIDMSIFDPARAGPQPSIPELPEVIHLLTRKMKALDLGCGEGANALVLAELGFSTTAVDACPHRIRELKQIARARLLPLHAVRGDPHAYQPRGMYDVIVAYDCFQRVHPDEQLAVIRKLQSHTRRGGFNVVIAVSNVSAEGGAYGWSIVGGRAGAADLYAGWKVLVHQSYISRRSHAGEGEIDCAVDKLIARRP